MAISRRTSAVTGVGQEVAALRRRLGLGQIGFSQALGVDQSTLAKWEKNVRPIPARAIVKFAEIAPEQDRSTWLQRAGLDKSLPEATTARVTRRPPKNTLAFVDVPLVGGRAGAGPAFFMESDEIEGHLSIPRSVCPNPTDTRCIRIFGDSMEPTIPNGTVAAVDGSQKRIDKLMGKIVAVRHETEGVRVKRLVLFEGHYVLASDKLGYPTFNLAPNWEIVGRVVWWIQTA